MRWPASSSVTSIQRTEGVPSAGRGPSLPSLGIRLYLYVVDFQEIDDVPRDEGRRERRQAGQRRSPARPSSDGKRINALDAPRIPPRRAFARGAQDEENQNSP